MSDLLEEIKSLKGKFDETLKAATEAQKSAKALDDKTAKTDSTVQKAAEDAAKTAGEVQELKLKISAVEKTAEYVEKSISRLGSTGDNQAKELEHKAKEEMSCFLRNETRLSNDVLEATVKAIVGKSYFGITEEKRDLITKDLISGSNPDSGYFIRPERSATMIRRIFETSPVRAIANIETTSSDSLEFIIDDNEATSGGWVGETSPRPTTGTPKIGQLTIVAHEHFAQPRATQKTIEDVGFDIEEWVTNKAIRKLTRDQNNAFVVGDGSQKPKGFMALPEWTTPSTQTSQGIYQRKALETILSGKAGELDGDTLKLVQNSLIEDYQANAVWGMKRATWQSVITTKNGIGDYILDPRSMKVGDTLTLLGKQVIFMHDMPEVAVDSVPIAYGDFGVGYTIVDRIGFRILRDPYLDKPNVLFYVRARTGGDVTSYESIKRYKLSA